MNIYAKRGAKVRFARPDAGYKGDQEMAAEHLTVGGVYTVERTDVGQSHTTVWLQEVPERGFNSVQFTDVCPKCNDKGYRGGAPDFPNDDFASTVTICGCPAGKTFLEQHEQMYPTPHPSRGARQEQSVRVPLDRLSLWAGRIQRTATNLDIAGQRELARGLWDVIRSMTHQAATRREREADETQPPQREPCPECGGSKRVPVDPSWLPPGEESKAKDQDCPTCYWRERGQEPQREQPLSLLAQGFKDIATYDGTAVSAGKFLDAMCSAVDSPAQHVATALAELLRHTAEQARREERQRVAGEVERLLSTVEAQRQISGGATVDTAQGEILRQLRQRLNRFPAKPPGPPDPPPGGPMPRWG